MGKKRLEQVRHEEKQRAPTGAQSGPHTDRGDSSSTGGPSGSQDEERWSPRLATPMPQGRQSHRASSTRAKMGNSRDRLSHTVQRWAHTCFPGMALQNKQNEPMGVLERGCLRVGCWHCPAPWRTSRSYRPCVLIRSHPRAQLSLVHFISCQFCLKRKEKP